MTSSSLIVLLPDGSIATVNDNDFEVGAPGAPTRFIRYSP